MKKMIMLLCLVLIVIGLIFTGGCSSSDPNSQNSSGCGGCNCGSCGSTNTASNEGNMASSSAKTS